jgi:hypothetical protein
LQSVGGSGLLIALTVVVGVEAMTKRPEHKKIELAHADARLRPIRKSVWDDAKIAIDIQYTKPGTTLDDHLRKEQTRALLDLLADYVQKLDKSGNAGP